VFRGRGNFNVSTLKESAMAETVEELLKRAVKLHMAGANAQEVPTLVYLAPDRYVTVKIYAILTGRSANGIRMKMRDGKWLEKREFIRDPDGTILIDREGVQRWVLRGS
jgi:hypothetical protein